jgi:HAD superfamily hydrolase (TIGR01509 family)
MTTTYQNLIIFDLDGVLIWSRELHYDALNQALMLVAGVKITREEHLSTYDGLPTKKKLEILTRERGVPVKLHHEIAQEKQAQTIKLLNEFPENPRLIEIFKYIVDSGYKIAVASNSVRTTLKTALVRLGIIDYVDVFLSNEDVIRPKPYPSMYWKCMEACNAIPSTTFIIEDSHIGRQGAIDSGATLIPVKDPSEVTLELLQDVIGKSKKKRYRVPWRDNKLNVLIPMAGLGSRFSSAGYTFPKPLIEVHGKPMIQVVVENLNIDAHYIFIVQKEHYQKYSLDTLLKKIAPNCEIIPIDCVTQGAACTTLLASDNIDSDNPLIIANSDQFIEWNSNECLYAFSADAIDGGLLTFKSSHPKWSYAKLDEHGFVSEVAEKRVISDNATVGVYYWKKGSDYVKYADQMIRRNIRTNNEFYVAPVFNEAIKDGLRFRIKEVEHMWGLGTPEDLNYFLANYERK